MTNEQALDRDSRQELSNIALLVEQNVLRTASELDRTLKFLRQVNQIGGDVADWPSLVKQDYTINDQAVQIAIIDRDGMMITSSAMLHPKPPVDLSDREHYLVHARSGGLDNLFISKPVLGRASGKWSVQFTRPFKNPDGSFAGVIVVSLDPAVLSRTFGDLKLGSGYGLAIIGDDRVVRAGSGLYASIVGEAFPAINESADLTDDRAGVEHGAHLLSMERHIGKYPMQLVVTFDRSSKIAALARGRDAYFAGAGLLTLISALIIAISVFSRRRFEHRIVTLAHSDVLTGLPNRLRLSERLEHASEKARQGESFALHLIDLDGFKTVNDTYGHPIGDLLLQAVAERLKKNLRACDILARLGGDEFAVIQPLSTRDRAGNLAERMCELLSKPFTIDHLSISIGGSVGIACCPSDTREPRELLRLADLALYETKATDRGVFNYFDASMNLKAVAQRSVRDGLREGLVNGEFEIHYQPIFSLSTGRTTKFEALIRWNHPVRGLISPADFIPIAEETGMVVAIGDWVLEQACRDIARCPPYLAVSVNCSPIQLKSAKFTGRVKELLDRYDLPPRRLILEITETTLMRDDMLTMQSLRELRELGIQLSMDDFGTGYSSLGYLQRYPITCIKIDRSFVNGLTEVNSVSSAILGAIVTLAHCLKMEVIAEGVETFEQLTILKSLGCEEAQGYYLGRPMPASQALPFMAVAGASPNVVAFGRCA